MSYNCYNPCYDPCYNPCYNPCYTPCYWPPPAPVPLVSVFGPSDINLPHLQAAPSSTLALTGLGATSDSSNTYAGTSPNPTVLESATSGISPQQVTSQRLLEYITFNVTPDGTQFNLLSTAKMSLKAYVYVQSIAGGTYNQVKVFDLATINGTGGLVSFGNVQIVKTNLPANVTLPANSKFFIAYALYYTNNNVAANYPNDINSIAFNVKAITKLN